MTETHLVWDTFLVRIWREPASDTWRGEITHLPTQTSAHFATLIQAMDFIRRFITDLEVEGQREGDTP